MTMNKNAVTIFFGILSAFIFLTGFANAQDTIIASEASKFIGKTATVCGEVACAKYADRSKGRPTFLNLDKPYPNHVFTAVIWGQNRGKFKTAPEVAYQGKRICVTGTVEAYRGKPEIVVKEPAQIRVGK